MNSIRDSEDFKQFFMLDRMENRVEHDEGESICLAGERRKGVLTRDLIAVILVIFIIVIPI